MYHNESGMCENLSYARFLRSFILNIRDYNKIVLVGSGGSGKSWLAKRIAELTDYPLYHLDNEFWKPGWTESPRDEFIKRQQEIIKSEKWIIEGAYNSTLEMRFVAADLIIFLDINRIISIVSAAKRHGKKRSDLPDYLDENTIFSKDFFELCKYIWSYPKKGRKTVITLHEKYPDKILLHVKTRGEVQRLLMKWLHR